MNEQGHDSGGLRDPRVAVIGAGMSGILAAIKLAQAGLHDVALYEKADRLGGTWRDNTYPGIQLVEAVRRGPHRAVAPRFREDMSAPRLEEFEFTGDA